MLKSCYDYLGMAGLKEIFTDKPLKYKAWGAILIGLAYLIPIIFIYLLSCGLDYGLTQWINFANKTPDAESIFNILYLSPIIIYMCYKDYDRFIYYFIATGPLIQMFNYFGKVTMFYIIGGMIIFNIIIVVRLYYYTKEKTNDQI